MHFGILSTGVVVLVGNCSCHWTNLTKAFASAEVQQAGSIVV